MTITPAPETAPTTATAAGRRRRTRRLVGAAALLGSLAVAGPAVAHIHVEPARVAPGARATVAFRIGHGCDGSPTVKVALKVPAGVSAVKAGVVAGWKVVVAKGVVTWTGGPLGPETAQHFPITATFTKKVGVLSFPIVQTCKKGELAWIEPVRPGAPEPAHPTALLGVGVAAGA